jgi:hypothetical protein
MPKYDRDNGANNVAPVDRRAVVPEVRIWTASAALPVTAKSQPRFTIALAFQNTASFSSAKAASSSLAEVVFA